MYFFYSIASCCCDTKNAIITQGQLTRDAIAQFRSEETADKLLIARNKICRLLYRYCIKK